MPFSSKQTAMLLALLVSVFFLVCLFFLFQNPMLQSQDAAYYLRGVESIQKTGFLPAGILEYPPIFFLAAAFFSLFAGTVSGIKIAAAVFAALSAIGVFLLARQLLKNNEAALVSVIFFLIAPVSMRLLNGFWKTTTALCFLPLFFYFFLRAEKSTKNLLLAIAMLLLLFLSHKLVALLALLVLLAFVVFQLVFERKITVEAKNFIKISVVFAILFFIVFFASQKNLSEFAGLFGLINATGSSSASASFWQYFGAIVLAVFFGALYCFFSAKKEQLFLLAWFCIGLFVAMPLTSGDNYWRFAFLLAMPFALLSGVFFSELKKSLGNLNATLVFLVVAVLVLPQFYNAAAQIVPVYSEKDLLELQELLDFSGGAKLFAKGVLLQWLQYFEANASAAGENIVLDAKQLVEKDKRVFLAIDKQRKMLDFSEQQARTINNNFSIAFETPRFLLLKPDTAAVFPQYNFVSPANIAGQPRFGNPVLWLFFPAELFNFFQLPFASALRALIGLPLSLALIAFILQQLNKRQNHKNFRSTAFILVALIVLFIAIAK